MLRDMEQAGVEMDQGTLRMLGDIGEERAKDLYNSMKGHGIADQEAPEESGEDIVDEMEARRGGKWWHRSKQREWWPRIEEWRGVIARRLAEREQGEVIREGPYGSLMRDEVSRGYGDGRRDTGKVWL